MKYTLFITFSALLILTTLGSHAQRQYSVTTRIQLNVRSGPGTSYAVIGQLAPRSTITVIGTQDQWAAIAYNNRTGYVALRHLSPVSPTAVPRAARSHTFFSGYSLFWPLLILGLTFLPVLIGQAGFENNTAIWIVRLSLIGTAITELAYFIGMGFDFWWCYPSQVGWGWAIVGVFASFVTFSVQYQFLRAFSDHAPKASETFKTLNIHYLNIISLSVSLILIFYGHLWAIFLYPTVLFGTLYLQCRRWTTALLYTFTIGLYSVALICTFITLLYFAIIVLIINIAGQMLAPVYFDRYGNAYRCYF